ncbi:MAG: hypothetical protein HN337_00990 [Deltaproteobacteria bacterium]|nr:hypothetical protein [Deltaproteobacteria bacterium]
MLKSEKMGIEAVDDGRLLASELEYNARLRESYLAQKRMKKLSAAASNALSRATNHG